VLIALRGQQVLHHHLVVEVLRKYLLAPHLDVTLPHNFQCFVAPRNCHFINQLKYAPAWQGLEVVLAEWFFVLHRAGEDLNDWILLRIVKLEFFLCCQLDLILSSLPAFSYVEAKHFCLFLKLLNRGFLAPCVVEWVYHTPHFLIALHLILISVNDWRTEIDVAPRIIIIRFSLSLTTTTYFTVRAWLGVRLLVIGMELGSNIKEWNTFLTAELTKVSKATLKSIKGCIAFHGVHTGGHELSHVALTFLYHCSDIGILHWVFESVL